jgi:hypothetical protein
VSFALVDNDYSSNHLPLYNVTFCWGTESGVWLDSARVADWNVVTSEWCYLQVIWNQVDLITITLICPDLMWDLGFF